MQNAAAGTQFAFVAAVVADVRARTLIAVARYLLTVMTVQEPSYCFSRNIL